MWNLEAWRFMAFLRKLGSSFSLAMHMNRDDRAESVSNGEEDLRHLGPEPMAVDLVEDAVVEVGELVRRGDHVDAEVVILSGQRSSNDVREEFYW
ncbi:hypothetical protein TorRG33x02_030240 [Trema orientale]|uniref:Uncharacterized protein n=1 Tax=Trema orientale TaxID=63057 RepID=A0A2P5FU22_TREOI|nr:hypothetical protein TorRG33x02_030240 [Trema orientale]